MALSSGSPIFDFDSWVTLESSGASVSAGAISAAASTEATSSNHQDAILVEFGAEIDFGANTPDSDASVELHIKKNTIGGTATQDTPSPSASFDGDPKLARQLNAASGSQYVHFGRIALPAEEFDCYLKNNDSTDPFTWALYMRPVSTTTVT